MSLDRLYHQQAQTFLSNPEFVEQEELFTSLDREATNTASLIGAAPGARGLDMEPTDPVLESVGYMSAAGIGFREIPLTGSAFAAINDDELGVPNPEFDPEYNALLAAQDNAEAEPDMAELAREIESRGTEDPLTAAYVDRLGSSNGWEHTRALLARYKAQKEMLERSDAAGLAGYATGALAGLSLDVILSIALGRGAGLLGSGERAVQVVRTIAGARAAGAARVGALAGMEGGLDGYLQTLSQDHLTVDDVLLSAGFGFAVGGALGSVLPNTLMGIKSIEGMRRFAETVEEQRRLVDPASGSKSAGAAKVENFDALLDDAAEEITAPDLPKAMGRIQGGASIVDAIPGIKALRSPRSIARSVIARAQKLRETGKGSRGMDFLAGILHRTYDQSVQLADDFKGIARPSTLVGDIKMFEHKSQVLELRSRVAYNEFAAEVYPDRMRRSAEVLRNEFRRSTLNTGALNEKEFIHFGDLYMQATHEKRPDAADAVLEMVRKRVPPNAADKVEAHLRKVGSMWDDFYLEMGKLEARLGFIDPKELRPGYRPQLWDGEKIIGDEDAFRVQLMDHLTGKPSDEWLAANAPRVVKTEEGAAEGAVREVEESILKTNEDGSLAETWEEFAEREPSIAAELRTEWEAQKREKALEKLEALRQEAELEAQALGFKTATEAMQNHDEVIGRMVRQRERLEDRLHKTFSKDGTQSPEGTMGETMDKVRLETTRHRLQNAIDRVEAAMHVQQNLYDDLRRAIEARQRGEEIAEGASASLDDLLLKRTKAASRVGIDAKARADLKSAQRKLKRIEAKVAKAAARSSLEDVEREVQDIVNAMVGRRSPGQFESDKLIQTSRHMKRRVIDLSGVRHEDKWQRFLVNDPILVAQRYTNSMGRQIALRKQFMPYLRAQGLLGDDIDPKTVDVLGEMKKKMQREFDADRARIRKEAPKDAEKQLKKLRDAKRQADELFDRVFGEVTRTDYTEALNDPGKLRVERAVHIAQSATASMGLGWVLASNIQDLAVAAMAGGRFMTGLKKIPAVLVQSILRQPRAFDELMKVDADLAFLAAGANVRTMAMMTNRFDIESTAAEYDFPGSKYRRVARTAQSVAVLQGWVNLMHPWNRVVRESFGVDFMDQIGKDLMKYDQLDTRMKAFYSKLGISAEDASEMGRLFKSNSIKVRGTLRIPDFKAWNNPKLETKYRRAILAAGHEAMMDPNVGDRPFLRRTVLGRIILQFSSFIYTAGNNFIAPMIQQAMMNPKDAGRMLAIVGMAMGLSAVGEALRAGRSEGPDAVLRTAGKLAEGDSKLWSRSFMRSPFVLGLSGVTAEAAVTPFAPSINRTLGVELFDTKYNRLHMSQGPLGALFGPVGGNITALYRTAGDIANGDSEALKRTAYYKTPIVNTFPAWVLFNTLKQIEELFNTLK